MKAAALLEKIQRDNIQFVDLRFTDTLGKEQHVTLPVGRIDEALFDNGKSFDGSSIKGWCPINESDMLLMPQIDSAVLDPFYEEPTLLIRCDVLHPKDMQPYNRDPRSIAKRAEAYLQETGIADTAYFGPEPEFFLFDSVQFHHAMHSSGYTVDAIEGAWNNGNSLDGRNLGHRPAIKGGYFPVPPVDSEHDIRATMVLELQGVGIQVEAHHHEVAGCQHEIAIRFNTLVQKADESQLFKYVIHNVARSFGKTATFMPKPLLNDNGNGMHVHQSLSRQGENLFAGEGYGGLSEMGLHYIGGIMAHARSLSALTNASTNSYKRLVPGFEAPTDLTYSARNRSAAVRIPHVGDPKQCRIEVRFPDSSANPYLAFAAMLLAGLDGIERQLHPGQPIDKDLYQLSKAERAKVPQICASLGESLRALEEDYEYLLAGKVFCKDFLESYVALKQAQVKQIAAAPHPLEFDLYYSV